jgi:uncharacterized protein
LAGNWIKPDGRARVQVYPKGDPDDNEVLRQFARAVLAVEPTASGGPISILESGRTVITAFIQAGFTALISIAIMLWITLRRWGDVLMTLLPLLLAGVLTLEVCVLIGLKLNFANIIALPLLLDGFWQPVAVKPPGHLQRGQIAAPDARMHSVRSGAVSADPDGAT